MDETHSFHLHCDAEFNVDEEEVVERTYDISFCSNVLLCIVKANEHCKLISVQFVRSLNFMSSLCL